jgi:hypothetical protein
MNSKKFFIILCIVVMLILVEVCQAGITYNPESVCNCQGSDGKTRPCLCASSQGRSQSSQYNQPHSSSSYYNPHQHNNLQYQQPSASSSSYYSNIHQQFNHFPGYQG